MKGGYSVAKSKWDVFVSYSSKDIGMVSVITDDLRHEGLTLWQDQSAILPGERVREAIHEGLQGSACILMVISQSSLCSKWVINELDAAMIREMREGRNLTIPILLDKIDPASLPFDIQGKKCVDLSGNFSKTYQQHRSSIVNVVRLVSKFGTAPLRDEVPMGNEAVAMLLTKDFSKWNQYKHFVDSFINNIFAAEWDWSKLLRGKNFLNHYGLAATKRLVMFILDNIGFDPSGFKAEDMQELISMFMLITWFTMSYNIYGLPKGETLMIGINREGKIDFRIANADL